MQCAKCKYPLSRVVKVEHDDLKGITNRRRECMKCGIRFTTHEEMRERDRQPKPLDDRYPVWGGK